MSKNTTSYLRLHAVDVEQDRTDNPNVPGFDLDALLHSFAQATGWLPVPRSATRPHLAASTESMSATAVPPLRSRIKLVGADPLDGCLDGTATAPVVAEDDAWTLLEQIDALVQQLAQAEQALEKQEAQLATNIGVSISADETDRLTERLKHTLQQAILQTGSDAGAIYLLDDTTSELKMRCVSGLPVSRLAAPARPLRGAMADLEALLGHAVLIENTALAPEWNCPEDFAAAICLPIGSPTMPHGTLWLWSNHVRDFSTMDIEIGKLAAEKVLVEIERSVLADEVLKSRSLSRDAERASLLQATRLPSSQPVHEDYDVAGWTYPAGGLCGSFHTWDMNKEQAIVGAIGDAKQGGALGAMIVSSVQSIIEACCQSVHHPSQIMRRANDVLWQAYEGEAQCSLGYFHLEPTSGTVKLSLAGTIRAFLIGPQGYRPLRSIPTRLASQPDTQFLEERFTLAGGELLLMATASVFDLGGYGKRPGEPTVLDAIREMYEEPTDRIAEHLARMMPVVNSQPYHYGDRSLVLLRRRF
ncbi:MAG: hypothetical protein KatS3mg111_0079 [Pirellulaceae bacterium]|nr:MAG: hypothetical protein KatS3mg111_0079 [Pirellulaceae bacterium]